VCVAARARAGVFFCLGAASLLDAAGGAWTTTSDAKNMTARSPDDSAGEHNNRQRVYCGLAEVMMTKCNETA
jgi:hypothetical protein